MDESTPKPQPPRDDATQIVRRLQGEDGYDIFTDRRTATDDRDRLRREYEDSRP